MEHRDHLGEFDERAEAGEQQPAAQPRCRGVGDAAQHREREEGDHMFDLVVACDLRRFVLRHDRGDVGKQQRCPEQRFGEGF